MKELLLTFVVGLALGLSLGVTVSVVLVTLYPSRITWFALVLRKLLRHRPAPLPAEESEEELVGEEAPPDKTD